MVSLRDTRIWFPWQSGPEDRADGPVLVSLTDYTMRSLRSYPGIVRAGSHLALGWYGLPGAVGLFLWTDPLRRHTGSVSVWTDERQMRRWVGLPYHRQIMRRYRTRGSLMSTTWTAEPFDRTAVLAEAKRRLAAEEFA